MDSIRFDFIELRDIRPALLRCAVGSRGNSITYEHLPPLRKLATGLGATQYAKKNAELLATGYEDLVVILLEPSDKAEDVSYDEMFHASTALKDPNGSLLLAFYGQCSVENTIVLDIRPFRSKRIRMRQEEEERNKDDAQAYVGVKEVLALLHPEVLLACQCQTPDEQEDLLTWLCSSVRESGTIQALAIPNADKDQQ